MTIAWKKTNFLGVRYREHKTRKHGGNRPDKCFYIHYKVDEKTKDEAVGWSSEGVTAEGAFKILSQLRENIRLGKGPRTFAELRAENEQEALREQNAQALKQAQAITFSQFWESEYFPAIQATKKPGTISSERWLYTKWIAPAIGHVALKSLSVREVEGIITKARNNKKSAATLRYILAIISQVWRKAEILEIVSGECPCRKIPKPRQDNRRMRFLTEDEASRILSELELHSPDMRDIALLSLYTGMRAGEIHCLRWGNINFSDGSIAILDPKSKKNRIAFMTPEVKAMFTSRYEHQPKTQFVFPSKNGKQRKEVSETFNRVVNLLGLNDTGEFQNDGTGEKIPIRITDARHKVVFHTLRHTYASWLVQRGVPLYTVAELMGHSTIDMTRRYSHLAPDSLRKAAMTVGGILSNEPQESYNQYDT